MVAYVYPAYASIRAIETTDDPDDDTIWLKYWLVFSIFKLVEGVADSILQYIPIYAVCKAAFLVWCMLPSTRGATKVYDTVILLYVVPYLNVHSHIGKDKQKDGASVDGKKDQ